MEEEELKGLPKAGDVLAGRYTIEGVIGAGGMGVVLAARHSVLGQRVAVKFLLPDLAKRQPEAAERFVREARAAIHLKSEHVARVMDVGTEPNGAAYMVMEFLEGKDLQRVGREQAPLGVAWVVDCVLQAAEALAEAAARHITRLFEIDGMRNDADALIGQPEIAQLAALGLGDGQEARRVR